MFNHTATINATLLPLSPFIKGGLRGIIKEEIVVDENFFRYLYEDQ